MSTIPPDLMCSATQAELFGSGDSKKARAEQIALSPDFEGALAPPIRNDFFSRKMIPNLDGLRGVAILLVLLHHVPELHPTNPLWTLQFNGRLGVSLFFTISGFLIATLFLRERAKHGAVNLKLFYLRRILRLFPLYYLVLAIEAAIVVFLGAYSPENRIIFMDKLPSYLFYFSNWHPLATKGPFFVSWSLAVEEQFYVVFGLLFAFVSRWTVASICLFLLGAKILIYNFTPVMQVFDALPWRVAFSYEEPILLGVLLGFFLHHDSSSVFRRFRLWILIGSVLVVIGVLLFCPVTSKTSFIAQLFYVAGAFMVGGFAISCPNPILTGRLLSYVGIISYGIYLLHMLVFNAIKRSLSDNPIVILLIGAPAVVLIAGLSYRFVERPFLTLKERFHPESITTR